MNRRKNTIAVAVLLTTLGFWAFAEEPACPAGGPPKGGPGWGIMRADSDGDGRITLPELQAIWPGVDEEVFARLDRNGDGVLTPDDRRGKGPHEGKPEKHQRKASRRGEGPAGPPMPPPPPGGFGPGPQGFGPEGHLPPGPGMGPGGPQGFPGAPRPQPGAILEKLREADKDGNKEVTFEELSAVAPKMDQEKFSRLDRNGDGVISAADWPGRQQQGPGPAGQGPGFQGPGPQGGAPFGPGGPERGQHLRQLFQEADTDGDGKLTYEELSAKFPQMNEERFKRWDRNQDGFISREDRGTPPEPPKPE